jgi:hypothetical protein
MITVFPVRSFSLLPQIVLLARSPGDQLHRVGDDAWFSVVPNKKVDMVGGDGIVQHAEAVAFFCFEKPLHPPAPVPDELQ